MKLKRYQPFLVYMILRQWLYQQTIIHKWKNWGKMRMDKNRKIWWACTNRLCIFNLLLLNLKKNEYFCYEEEDWLDVFLEKRNKIEVSFAYFIKKIKIDMTADETREHKTKKAC